MPTSATNTKYQGTFRRGPPQRGLALVLRTLVAMLCTAPMAALAQSAPGNQGALDLPRPGYELGRLRLGNTILYPSLSVFTGYDSNLFSTSSGAQSVLRTEIAPRLDVAFDGAHSKFRAQAYANARFNSRYTSEDRTAFGVNASLEQSLDSRDKLDGELRFDRAFMRRADPEVNRLLLRPALFNSLSARLGFTHQQGRLTVSLHGTVQNISYLDPGEAERELTSYQIPLRVAYAISPRSAIFVEAYVNRRDARLPFDRSGVDRDLTTFGALAGISFDLSDRLRGEIGVGGFNASPDGSLPAFSGVAFNGRLRWSPMPRTAVMLNAFRGDVATVQSGATGRIDTRVNLRVDQEIRHNLLGWIDVGYRGTTYRGNLNRKLDTVFVSGELEYLASRTVSVFANVLYEHRSANRPLDRFDQTVAGVGIRLHV